MHPAEYRGAPITVQRIWLLVVSLSYMGQLLGQLLNVCGIVLAFILIDSD